MFVGGEGSSVDIEVGVDLYGSDGKSTRLEKRAHTASDDALAYPAYNTTAHQNILNIIIHCLKSRERNVVI